MQKTSASLWQYCRDEPLYQALQITIITLVIQT